MPLPESEYRVNPENGDIFHVSSAEAIAEELWPSAHLRKMIHDGDSRHYGEAVRRRAVVLGIDPDEATRNPNIVLLGN